MSTQLVQAEGEPEVFVVILEEKKCWVQTYETLERKGWADLVGGRQTLPLSELNKWPTGDTILWEDGQFIVGSKPREIYFPTEVIGKSYGCRAWLNHQQIIPAKTPTKIELDRISYDPEGCFDLSTHSYIVKADEDHIIIGEVWYDLSCIDGGVYSVQVRQNNNIIMERDDMCSSSTDKDIQPHTVDILPLKKDDRISLWTVGYGGGPYRLKVAERQNYLTIRKFTS